jgi:hypothetical protein
MAQPHDYHALCVQCAGVARREFRKLNPRAAWDIQSAVLWDNCHLRWPQIDASESRVVRSEGVFYENSKRFAIAWPIVCARVWGF